MSLYTTLSRFKDHNLDRARYSASRNLSFGKKTHFKVGEQLVATGVSAARCAWYAACCSTTHHLIRLRHQLKRLFDSSFRMVPGPGPFLTGEKRKTKNEGDKMPPFVFIPMRMFAILVRTDRENRGTKNSMVLGIRGWCRGTRVTLTRDIPGRGPPSSGGSPMLVEVSFPTTRYS